jgi:hypothetical protein
MKVLLPHQILEHKVRSDFDRDIRQKFFRGLQFADPAGDPGWFGPGSAVWHVHSHTSALIFGLQCAAFIERLDPSIYWMGSDHSRVVERDEDGNPTGRLDPDGAQVRLAHSLAFFIGTAYGSTATAEKVAATVRAMHHTIKGVRPDGLAYDADDAGQAASDRVYAWEQTHDIEVAVVALPPGSDPDELARTSPETSGPDGLRARNVMGTG